MGTVDETPQSSALRLEVSLDIEAPPTTVWQAFIDPELITQWWADEADTDPVLGGRIEARWPRMEWTMRGTYVELDPGRTVAFTWAWLHEPDGTERTVRATVSREGERTRLTLSHGDYGPDEADERAGHLEGWHHFLPRLAATVE